MTEVNRTELAHALKVSLPTIDRFRERGMPCVQEGGMGKAWVFDLEDCIAWRDGEEEREQAKAEAKRAAIAELDLQQADDRPENLLSLREREEYYRAEDRRIEVNRKRGFLVHTAEVRQQFTEVFAYISDRLQTLPDFLERRCALKPDEVDEVQKAVDQWQEELARLVEEQTEPDDVDSAA